ncbi:MAG TPA: MlaD family protein [Jatrophihabitans sp.]|jgi:phospholipid/cholesterol/gamma-HCH transport system substrate-binding protein|uniref:MlaD family protein n=1 Tax=Jatrophihabitans sp. TaxID=1932789 RepID=UPI002E0192BE|nr:MlaD family protein [Jatrophihabitans sp.]
MADAKTRSDMDGVYTKPVETKRVPRVGRSFTSRNPTPIGAIGLVLIAVLLFAAFNAASLPLIGGGTPYTAVFNTSANLKQGDDVRIAGVKVGKVESVTIDRAKGNVRVSFTVKDGWVGNESRAAIKLRTLLGAKYVEIDSSGPTELKSGGTIPLDRTESPFDVYPAFTALTQTVDKINTANLTKAFNVLAADFAGTPSTVKPVVTGLSRLSETIASRDTQLRTLLSRANAVTQVLADRDTDLQRLLSDGNLLLDELNQRRDAIHSLLINTQVLSVQLRGLVADNEKTIGPLLDNLNKVLALLQSNQDSLDRGLSLLGPFYRVFNNVIGNGHWFDNYIQNFNIAGGLGLAGVGGA